MNVNKIYHLKTLLLSVRKKSSFQYFKSYALILLILDAPIGIVGRSLLNKYELSY